MGLFDHLEDAFKLMSGDRGFQPEEREPSKLHEMLAGGAAFAAMHQFEAKRQAEGHKDHVMARELLAALTGAEVDRMIESRGLDAVDSERAKRQAYEQASQMYETQYVQQEGYAPQHQGYAVA